MMAKEGKYAQLRMPSGEIRNVPQECYATIGVVSNIDHENISIGKAGVDLGTRASLLDIGSTIAENFGLKLNAGKSFLAEIT